MRYELIKVDKHIHHVKDTVTGEHLVTEDIIDHMNSLDNENTFLKQQRDYWKKKFDDGVETFEARILLENTDLKRKNEELERRVSFWIKSTGYWRREETKNDEIIDELLGIIYDMGNEDMKKQANKIAGVIGD